MNIIYRVHIIKIDPTKSWEIRFFSHYKVINYNYNNNNKHEIVAGSTTTLIRLQLCTSTLSLSNKICFFYRAWLARSISGMRLNKWNCNLYQIYVNPRLSISPSLNWWPCTWSTRSLNKDTNSYNQTYSLLFTLVWSK